MGILRLALYDVKMLLRSKDMLFWSIAWPIIWMLMTAFIFVPPTSGPAALSITIIDMDNGFSYKELAKLGIPFNSTGIGEGVSREAVSLNFTKKLVETLEDYAKEKSIKLKLNIIKAVDDNVTEYIIKGRSIIREKDVDLVIIIPPNASECYTIWAPVRLGILVKASSPTEEYMNIGTILQSIMNMSKNTSLHRINKTLEYMGKRLGSNGVRVELVMYGLYGIAFPLVPQIEVVKPKAVEDRPGVLGWITIGALGYIAMLSSMNAATGFFVYKKESGILRRLMASPLRLRTLIAIDLTSTLIFEALSMIVLVLVGLALGARIILDIMNPLHILAIIVIAIAALFAYGMGLLIAPFTRSARGASGLATAVSLILVFTTGIWWPPKQMLVGPLRVFAEVFPPSIAFDVVRDLVIWQRSLEYILPKLVVMSYGCIILLITVIALYYRRLEKIASKII